MTARLYVGDVRDRIREIPDGSVDLIVTSPPFLALRKYGDDGREMGSEANPAAFVDGLLDLCAEFRRVLAPHGSIAVELGDTYSGSGGAGGDYNEDGLREGQPIFTGSAVRQRAINRAAIGGAVTHEDASRPGTKSRLASGNGWPLTKSLAGIPEAFMLSLAYGWNVLDRNAPDSPAGRWRVRNVIVWARPNPPVGALADKCRPATSYITVACTSAQRWFDLDAVREPHKDGRTSSGGGSAMSAGLPRGFRGDIESNPAGAPPLDWWEDDDPTGHATLVLPTQPYSGSHYAVWPATLAQRLIDMLCPRRVCTICGEPSRRIVEAQRVREADDRQRKTKASEYRLNAHDHAPEVGWEFNRTTLGWTDCALNGCLISNQKWRNGVVLDPFAGSGTTLAVATGMGRDAIGIELYEANAQLIRERCGMFLEVVA